MIRGNKIFQTITKKFWKIIRPVYQKIEHKIMFITITESEKKTNSDNGSIMFRLMEEKDIDTIGNKMNAITTSLFRDRLKRDLGVIAFHKNKFAGYVWVGSEDIKNQGTAPFFFDISLPEKTDYYYDGFIVPEKRKFGIITKMHDYTMNNSRSRGIKTVYYIVDKNNTGMLRAAEKVGFQPKGVLTYKRFMNYTTKNISELEKL